MRLIVFCLLFALAGPVRAEEPKMLSEIVGGDPPAVAADKVFWEHLERATPKRFTYHNGVVVIHNLGVDRINTPTLIFTPEVRRIHGIRLDQKSNQQQEAIGAQTSPLYRAVIGDREDQDREEKR